MTLPFIRKLAATTLVNGVVGMNFRNRQLVNSLNPLGEIAAARDKITTKERLAARGVATAPTITVIRRGSEISGALQLLRDCGRPFVVKPARSAQGRGIILCRGIDDQGVTKLSGARLAGEELMFHLYQILHGEFSFGRPDDAVLIEELIQTDRDWVMPDLPGPPDLRIVICNGEVLMAMARLPTSKSDGRANLHCGAVGIGIDLQTGLTRGGVMNDRLVDFHPDNGLRLEGNTVRDFDRCLQLALRCCEAFDLGYMGIDLMRDVNRGPLVLEVNSRPGLGLQIANRRGIL